MGLSYIIVLIQKSWTWSWQSPLDEKFKICCTILQTQTYVRVLATQDQYPWALQVLSSKVQVVQDQQKDNEGHNLINWRAADQLQGLYMLRGAMLQSFVCLSQQRHLWIGRIKHSWAPPPATCAIYQLFQLMPRLHKDLFDVVSSAKKIRYTTMLSQM